MSKSKPEVVAFVDLYQGHGKQYVSLAQGVSTENLDDGEPLIRLRDYERLQEERDHLRAESEMVRRILNKQVPGVSYGCHCDLEPGMEPDDCVIERGSRHECVYSKSIRVKEECDYWQPIVIKGGQ